MAAIMAAIMATVAITRVIGKTGGTRSVAVENFSE